MINIKQGDCLELMKEIPDKSIDMILCDLPYGRTVNKWDKTINSKLLWKQYDRIIKDNGAIILFGIEPFSSMLRNSNLKLYKYDWVWEKTLATNFLNAHKMPLRIHENIMVFYKHLPVYNPQMRVGFKPYSNNQGRQSTNYGKSKLGWHSESKKGERFPLDIIKFKKDKDKLHPTQKPIPLLEYLIKTYTHKNETVLDNCMGSGSTGIAAINTDRNFIGYELDDYYYKVAKDRINEHLKEKEGVTND